MQRRTGSSERRRGGVTVVVALMLIPLFMLVAFAVDLNYVWRADGELQNAADAAALAGTARLLAPNLRSVGGLLAPNSVRDAASTAATGTATAVGQLHTAGDAPLVISSADVQVGYIADPAADASSSAGRFQTGFGSPFPNSVQVTVRRDSSVGPGPLRLFFGALFGTPTTSRTATATATLRGQNITGFSGPGCRLLPLAAGLDTQTRLTSGSSQNDDDGDDQPSILIQDNYTVQLPIDAGATPPANVSAGPDGLPEIVLYLDRQQGNNFGLACLSAVPTANVPAFDGWIRNGPSAADLATFGSRGLQASLFRPTSLSGGPAMPAALADAFQSIIGQPRILPIYVNVQGSGGSGSTYQVAFFLGVTVVAANLTGTDRSITLQACATIDPTVTLGGGSGVGSTLFVYQGISLSR